MTVTELETTLHLERACHPACLPMAERLYGQLATGAYDVCSVLRIPEPAAWRAEHRTARKRVLRAERLGYRFSVIRRHERTDEVHAINVSAPERQGRPMSAGYHSKPSSAPLPDYPCPRHAIRTYGVETAAGELVAYLYLYRSGELALVSQLLGHAEHLDAGIMYLLFAGVIAAEHELEPEGWLVYNRHDSGAGDGLRWHKERLGFRAERIRWEP